MSVPMRTDDHAYWMLEQGLKDPTKRSRASVYNEDCYICKDPEFAMMGLPLCYPCAECGGHVPADDCICSDCAHNEMDISDENPDDILPSP